MDDQFSVFLSSSRFEANPLPAKSQLQNEKVVNIPIDVKHTVI
jgi:hypothetical protein